MRIPISFQQRAARRADPSAADEVRSGLRADRLLLERIRSRGIRHEGRAPVLGRARATSKARFHRSTAFVPRQHARNAVPIGLLGAQVSLLGSLVDVEVISAASDYRPLDGLRGAALTDALAFFRRITESCVNGTIIVRIMKWWNFPSCMRILGNSCFCGNPYASCDPIRQTGGPEVLNWTAVDVGEPGSGQVRLRQTAAGLD